MKKLALILILLAALSACTADEPEPPLAEASIQLTSPAFAEGQAIPAQYTCNGADLLPELNWTEPPAGTQSFALIMDDPDTPGGTWVHWVLYNLPAEVRGLREGYAPEGSAAVGTNSWNRQDYGGPCPPSGEHRYFFKLYALDTVLAPDQPLDKDALLAQMEGHVLAQGELMGVYEQP